MTCNRPLELHLCFSLQADEAEYSEDQPNQHYDQVYDPHGVLLLLGENQPTRQVARTPILAGEPDNPHRQA